MAHPFDVALRIGFGRQEDHGDVAPFGIFLDVRAEGVAGLAGHDDVAENKVGQGELEVLLCLQAVRSQDYVVARREKLAQEIADFVGVFGNQDRAFFLSTLVRRRLRDRVVISLVDADILVCILVDRDPEGEDRSLFPVGREGERALVQTGQAPGVVQADPGADHAGSLGSQAVESLEDPFALVLGDADAVIFNIDPGLLPVLDKTYRDMAFLRSILDGVGDQVPQYLGDFLRVEPADQALRQVSPERLVLLSGGVATYCNTLPASKLEGRSVLDLGKVCNIAEVYVNGQYCGTAWKAPWTVDVTDALKEGDNALEIKVADLWINRLVGDNQPGAPERICTTPGVQSIYPADYPLKEAGLIGPVRLLESK